MIGALLSASCGGGGLVLRKPDYRAEARSRLDQAAAAERSGDIQGALALYGSACDLDPELWPAHLGRGRILESMGSLLEADRAFALAVETASPEGRAEALYQRGRHFQRTRRHELALSDLDRCVMALADAPPGEALHSALLQRAFCFRDLLRFREAERDARRVLDSGPSAQARSLAEALLVDIEAKRGSAPR